MKQGNDKKDKITRISSRESDITGIKFNYNGDKPDNDNSILVNAINKIGDGIKELERGKTVKKVRI